MIEDPEAISSFADHEDAVCGGWGAACTFCDAERALAIKNATRTLEVA